MTQPNPGDGNAAPTTAQNPPQAPATGPTATPQFVQPALSQPPPTPSSPGATADTTAENLAAQELLAAAMPDAGDPTQLGDAGKRAIAAERERAKAAEKLAAEQSKQLADLQKQLQALQPAADIFAQLRKAAVPDEDKTDVQKLEERLATEEKATADERMARLRLEVIQDKQLTKAHAEWLKGKTYEELAASADALLALFPAPATPAAQPGDPAPAAQGQPNGQQPAPTGPKPDPTQGARGAGIDLHSQIQDALAKGDVKTSIALKQQLAAQARNQ